MYRSLLLVPALIACSSQTQVSKEPPRPTADTSTALTATAAGPQATPAAPPGAPVPPPDAREAALSKAVLSLFEQGHLLHKTIDDDISRSAFDTYLERLDGAKMFLLRGDRDALAAYSDKIDDELRTGNLDLAHEGAKIFASRVALVDGWISSLLAAPMDHSDEEFIELDPKKTEPAATEQELRERWRRRLELEVLERVSQMEARLEPPKPAPKKPGAAAPPVPPPALPPSPDDKAIPPTWEGREAKARAELAKQYAGRFARLRTPEPLDAAADLVNAVASTLDPHTTYLPPADKANFDIQMTGSLEGIGAVLRERDHLIEVVEIVPGGASGRQGLLAAGDLIMSVQQSDGADPVDVTDMHIDEVVKMIRGPKGTIVKLRVLKSSGTQESIAITRDVVVVDETYARGAVLTRKPGGPEYGYIFLPSFYGGNAPGQRTAAGDVRRLLDELQARKVAGVVIDLRGNGGGFLGDAVKMTGELIDEGPVVQVQDYDGNRKVLADDKAGVDFDGKVVVLVDRFSASASEIVAGALQDYKRALIVGTTTHGKGTVQTLADLDRATGGQIELGSLKITIQQFFRVSGSSTQREGVTPDIALPDPASYVESGERELPHAIAWSQIAPANYQKLAPGWKLDALVKKSAARVAKNAVLAKVATTTAVLKARRNDTRVPLARTAWEARRKEQKAASDAASLDPKGMPEVLTVKMLDEPAAAAAAGAGATPPKAPASPAPPKAPAPTAPTKAPAAAPPKAANERATPQERQTRWRDNLSRDPWIEECLNIMGDIK